MSGIRSTSTTRARLVAKYVSLRSAGVPRSAAAAMALSHACVRAIASSSRSIKLKPSCPPSVVATRFATGMKAGEAGIFSSARSRLAMSYLFPVCPLLHLPRRGRLELLSLSLGRSHAILDRLAHRVLRVGDRLPRPLRGILGPLDSFAAAQLDGLAPQAVDLRAAWPGRDVRADCHADETAADEPAQAAATTAIFL